MLKHILFSLLFAFLSTIAYTQPVVYKDASTLITGTWTGAGTGGTATLAEVTGQTPHEGTQHYKFDYNFLDWWAGIGLNMDNWGNGPALNFGGYSHLRIAYRGLSSGQSLAIALRNGSVFSNTIQAGGSNSTYTVIDIPIIALTAGSSIQINAIREINLSIQSTTQTGSGTVYFDAIELVNNGGGGNSAATSAATMARANLLGLGVNTSNWLEAYWLLPFGAYPEFERYTRSKVRDLRLAGFSTFRLPVIFERLGSTNGPDYPLDFNHIAFDLVDSMILWADIYDFKLVIVNHHGLSLTDANYPSQIPRLRAVWQQLTNRYDYLDPEQYFFEIYNEPTNEISNTNWRIVADAILDEIRLHDTPNRHSVFVGANQWNSGSTLVSFTPLDDADVIYTFHNYDPYFFTHQGMTWTTPPYFPPRTFPQSGEIAAINQVFSGVRSWANNWNVAVSLGEFGCSTQADLNSRCNWIETLKTAISTNNLSHFYWDAITPTDAFGFFNNGIINDANCIPCFKTQLGLFGSLPVSLESVVVKCDDTPKLTWVSTLSEAGYAIEIQRSEDGLEWESAAWVTGNTGSNTYTWQDNESYKYYRLHFVGPGGVEEYSFAQAAPCTNGSTLSVFPNPAALWINVQLSHQSLGIRSYLLSDVAGRSKQRVVYPENSQVQYLSVPVWDLPSGTYILSGQLSNGSQWSQEVVVRH